MYAVHQTQVLPGQTQMSGGELSLLLTEMTILKAVSENTVIQSNWQCQCTHTRQMSPASEKLQ